MCVQSVTNIPTEADLESGRREAIRIATKRVSLRHAIGCVMMMMWSVTWCRVGAGTCRTDRCDPEPEAASRYPLCDGFCLESHAVRGAGSDVYGDARLQ